MTDATPADETRPGQSGADAAGEAAPRVRTPFLVLQFFLFPMAIVAACVTVFVVFGLIARENKGARQHLEDIRRGGTSVFDLNRRWHAAYELSTLLEAGHDPALRDPRFVTEVLAAFESAKHDDPRVRQYLAVALGRLRDPRAVPVLLETLRAEGQGADDMRVYATVALGAIGDPQALPELLPLLSSSDAGVRKAAAHALGSFPDERSRAALSAALADPVEDVRWNAGLALARRGDTAAAPVLLAMMDRAHLASVAGMSAEQRDAALLEAVRAAGAVPDAGLRSALERLRQGDPSAQVREAAARALARHAAAPVGAPGAGGARSGR